MRLSISNIAWDASCDTQIYKWMTELGYTGLEIAPTRIFPNNPYGHLNEAAIWAKKLKTEYRLSISSMQSIWYGRQEKVFGSKEDRKVLADYTKRAIDFAEVIGCKNLVFGCPRNRATPEDMTANEAMNIAVDFFRELGEYAHKHNTVIAVEANPPIYNTNFINTTAEALGLVKQVNSQGFLVNLDVGTMIHNEESVSLLKPYIPYINHIHISEPGLKPLQKHNLHTELISLLKYKQYDRFVSIEMGGQDSRKTIQTALLYLEELIT